jgi:uncharacterized protein with GYD domain
MPYYLMQAAYTPESWAAQQKNPQDRVEAIRPVVEKLGGKMVAGFHSFGEYDVVTIVEMPNNTAARAFTIAASAGGALKALLTTPLMTTAEATEAMQEAAGAEYVPPDPNFLLELGH